MKNKIFIIMLLLIVATVAFSNDNSGDYKLPKPPKGFEWYRVSELNAAFLKPRGWHSALKKSDGNLVVGIAKENFIKKGSFKTGMTIFMQKYDGNKEEFVEFLKKQREGLSSPHRVLLANDLKLNFFEGFNTLYIMEEKGVALFLLLVGNPETLTYYVILFESPVKSFDRFFKRYGSDMVNQFILDTDF